MFMRTEGTHIRITRLHDGKKARVLAALALRSEFKYQVWLHTFVHPKL